jgi:hypothetical protein
MGLFGWLGKDGLAKPIEAVGGLYTTDKARLDAEAKLTDAESVTRLAQLENNRLMVVSGNVFNSGWIALLGWTSGFLVLLFYAPQIVIMTYIWAKLCLDRGIVMPFPMQPDDIMNLIYLLFGTGVLTAIKRKK